MPSGLQVINDWGTTQIDENYFNFALRYKGSAVCATPWSSGGVTKYRTNLWFDTLTHPLMAIRAPNGVCMYAVNRPVPDTMQFHFVSKQPNEAFDYYLFDAMVPNVGNAGLEVYNGAGQLCFGSGSKPLRLLGGFTGNGSYTAPAGRQVAVIQTNNGFSWRYEDLIGTQNYQYYAYLGLCRASANVGYGIWDKLASNFENYQTQFQQINYETSTPTFLVADVTNY